MTSFEALLQTPAHGPPVGTTSRLTPSSVGVDEELEETNASGEVVEKGLRHKVEWHAPSFGFFFPSQLANLFFFLVEIRHLAGKIEG